MCWCRLLTALQALIPAKQWRTAAKSGSLGALDVFAQAAARLLAVLAGIVLHWHDVSKLSACLESIGQSHKHLLCIDGAVRCAVLCKRRVV